jgi:hypothetical protein
LSSETFGPLVSHVQAITKNIGCEYAGEVLVPSGWFFGPRNQDKDKVSAMIEKAGIELVNVERIPSGISSDISSLVSRSHVVEIMNRYYGKFE